MFASFFVIVLFLGTFISLFQDDTHSTSSIHLKLRGRFYRFILSRYAHAPCFVIPLHFPSP